LERDHLNEACYRAHLYLGLCALETEEAETAREELMTASRLPSTRAVSIYYLGRLALLEKEYAQAIRYLEESANGVQHPAVWSTLAIAQRKLGSKSGAQEAIKEAYQKDPLDFAALAEQWIWGEILDGQVHSAFDRKDPTFVGCQLYLEQATNYMELGAWSDAIALLRLAIGHFRDNGSVSPLLNYYLGYCYERMDRVSEADESYRIASTSLVDYVFPYRKMSIKVLRSALKRNELDSNGWMYLGNVLTYLRQLKEGHQSWKKALKLDPQNPILLRSVAHATWHLEADEPQTLEHLKKAMRSAPDDVRVFWDLDHFYDFIRQYDKRLELFRNHRSLVESKDYLVDRVVVLLIRLGQEALLSGSHTQAKGYFEDAVKLMDETYFFTREAYNFLPLKFSEAHFGLGEVLLAESQPGKALEQFEKGLQCPQSLNETYPANPIRTRAHYLMGVAFRRLGDEASAVEHFRTAAEGPVRLNSESLYYRGLALKELGKNSEARNQFLSLVQETQLLLSKEDSPTQEFVLSQAYRGLGDEAQADSLFIRAFERSPNVILQARYEASHIPWEGGLQALLRHIDKIY
jgi:tetratricopeptide (TPR) repeat protein